MNRAFFKIRYLFCARFDSQHLLKLLIGFNVFLGIYLLFLSTNYRHYSEYAHNRPESAAALPPPAHIQVRSFVCLYCFQQNNKTLTSQNVSLSH